MKICIIYILCCVFTKLTLIQLHLQTQGLKIKIVSKVKGPKTCLQPVSRPVEQIGVVFLRVLNSYQKSYVTLKVKVWKLKEKGRKKVCKWVQKVGGDVGALVF